MKLDGWLNQLELIAPSTKPPAMIRCAEMLRHLGFKKFCPVITVGGTNGKGSVTHLLAAYLDAQGKKVGRFISPHLLHYNERIAVNNQAASDQQIIKAFEKIKAVQDGRVLGYFDYSLLAALLIFAEAQVDWIVLEVGLGGRLDATNCLDADCAVITTIHLDHTQLLGHDRERIGFEKAGIMRSGQLAICGDLNPPSSIMQQAQRIDANLVLVTDQDRQIDLPNTHFPKQNAYTAFVALREMADENVLTFDQDLFAQVAANLAVPGRMQRLQQQPEIIVDVAHNEESVKYLANYLKAEPVPGKNIAVFSVLKDKDFTTIIREVQGCFAEWNILAVDSPRALSLTEIEAAVQHDQIEVPVYPVFSVDELMAALNQRLTQADRVVVFGSFLIAHLFLKWYNAQK